MEFSEVVRRRRMVRRYAPDPVAPEVLDRILDHAQRGPSAGFSQGFAFLVLDTPDDVTRFWKATGGDGSNGWLDGMRTAPVVVVPLACRDAYLERYAEPDKGWTERDPAAVDARWPVPYWHVDAGMATLLILQTAVDEGLGACFFGIPPERVDAFREAFGVPGDHQPIGAVTIGHRLPDDAGPSGSPGRRPRRTGLVHRGRWTTT